MIGSSLDDIAREYDLRDILRTYGVKMTARQRVVLCPLPMHPHHNYTPSLSIRMHGDRQRFTCFGSCGKEGDVIDLVGFMEISGYDPTSLSDRMQAAERLTGEKFTKPEHPPIMETELPVVPQDAWKWFLPRANEVTEYGVKRGIDPSILDKHRIGSASSLRDGIVTRSGFHSLMAIPTFHGEELLGIKIRIINPTSKLRFFALTGSHMGLFNYDEVCFDNGKILIVKGEIPSMVLEFIAQENGFKVCAISGSENCDVSTSSTILRALAFGNKVLIGDNDRNPETDSRMKEFARKRATLLGAKLRFPPIRYKDVDEWHLNELDSVDTILRWFGEAE